MKILTMTAFAGLALTTAGCIIVDADLDEQHKSRFSDTAAERVYSADISENSITIRVAASGCTTKEYFDVDIDHEGGEKFTIEFERVRRDYCKMMQPDGEKLTWTYTELGLPAGSKVSLENPVGR